MHARKTFFAMDAMQQRRSEPYAAAMKNAINLHKIALAECRRIATQLRAFLSIATYNERERITAT